MTFDNQLLGFTFPQNGSFAFTFNVPHADPTTPHHIHAVQLYPFTLDIQASFTVLPEPSPPAALKVQVDAGSIYFPGDSATIYVSATQNGQQVSVSSLQVVIIKPDGLNFTLTTVQVSTGLWKATYTIPTTVSSGTYSVVAHARTGSVDGSALGSFEVKQSWLSANGRAVGASILGAIGMFGVFAVAWRKGVFNRRKEEFPPP